MSMRYKDIGTSFFTMRKHSKICFNAKECLHLRDLLLTRNHCSQSRLHVYKELNAFHTEA